VAKRDKYYTLTKHPESHMSNFLIVKKYMTNKLVSRHLIISKDLEVWEKMLGEEGYNEKI
jgi:hypothetical protein